jgi:hypothetical protein
MHKSHAPMEISIDGEYDRNSAPVRAGRGAMAEFPGAIARKSSGDPVPDFEVSHRRG